MIHIIAAIDLRRGLGFRGEMLFHIREDLRRFKALTTGHTVIMGRRTFESLPGGALPNRRNIVLSRSSDFCVPGAETAPSLAAALAMTAGEPEVFIIGGASVYAEGLAYADVIDLTLIHQTAPEADTFFPEIGPEFVIVDTDSRDGFDFITYRRKA